MTIDERDEMRRDETNDMNDVMNTRAMRALFQSFRQPRPRPRRRPRGGGRGRPRGRRYADPGDLSAARRGLRGGPDLAPRPGLAGGRAPADGHPHLRNQSDRNRLNMVRKDKDWWKGWEPDPTSPNLTGWRPVWWWVPAGVGIAFEGPQADIEYRRAMYSYCCNVYCTFLSLI